MVEIKKLGSTKRFGARYGARLKHILSKIEKEQKGRQICPYCHSDKVRRIAVGIWHCGRCDAKFTGKAYSVRKVVTAEEAEQETTDEKKDRLKAESEEKEEPENDE